MFFYTLRFYKGRPSNLVVNIKLERISRKEQIFKRKFLFYRNFDILVWIEVPYTLANRLGTIVTRRSTVLNSFDVSGWYCQWCGSGWPSQYSYSLRTGRPGDRIPVGGETRRTRPERPYDPLRLLYYWYRFPFPDVKLPGRDVQPSTPCSAEIKTRVELYLCSPSGPSWPVLGWTLSLPLP